MNTLVLMNRTSILKQQFNDLAKKAHFCSIIYNYMEKKEAARLLFMEGDSLVSISKLLGVSDTTLTKWLKEGDWKNKRTMRNLFEQTSVEAIKELADYQLQALVHLKNKLMAQGDWELLEKGHFDSISKAFSTIKGPEQKWEHVVRLIRRFLEYMQDNDIALAQSIEPHTVIFLNELRKHMQQ